MSIWHDSPPADSVPVPHLPQYRICPNGDLWTCWWVKGMGTRRGKAVVESPRWRRQSTYKASSGYRALYARTPEGTIKFEYLHRLVLASFVGPCPDGFHGCHFDGDRSNNSLSNLRWDSPAGNVADTVRLGRVARQPGELSGRARLTEQDVREMRRRSKNGEGYRRLAKAFGVHRSTARSAIVGVNWKHL